MKQSHEPFDGKYIGTIPNLIHYNIYIVHSGQILPERVTFRTLNERDGIMMMSSDGTEMLYV